MAGTSESAEFDQETPTDQPFTSYFDSPTPPDWSFSFKEGEFERMQSWHATGQGAKFVPFVPFMHNLRPDSVKGYRLYADSACRGYGLEQTMRAIVPLAMHYYIISRYPLGMQYSLNASRRSGMTKAEASGIYALAFLHAGVIVANEAAEIMEDYFALWAPDWDPEDSAPGFPWNDGWSVDADAFACGIDFSVPHGNKLLPGELDRLEEWHLRVEGEIPASVRHTAKYYPLQLLAHRARFEQTMHGHLPKQYIALARLQLAALWHEPSAARRALHMARYFGVPRDQALQALAHAQTYAGDIGMESSYAVFEDILDDWA